MLRKLYYVVRGVIKTYPIPCVLIALQFNLLLMSEYIYWRSRHLLDEAQSTLHKAKALSSDCQSLPPSLEARLLEYGGR
jgi:hypothetical protein